jgi:hypothetical protein
MRIAVAALVLALLHVASPAGAQEGDAGISGPVEPAVIQSLDDSRDTGPPIGQLTSTMVGAAGALLAYNVLTAGAALAPVVGIPTSNLVGGSWLGLFSAAPFMGDPAIHLISATFVALGGGMVGSYAASE